MIEIEVLHIIASFILILLLYFSFNRIEHLKDYDTTLLATIITFAIGLLKELYDYFDYGSTMDMALNDIASNIIGILSALIFILAMVILDKK